MTSPLLRAHCLQHVPFEGLAAIEVWLIAAGYDITYTRFYQDEPLPELHSIELIIVMGGPMSVSDEKHYPWLIQEKIWLKKAIESNKAILGICLGAQLIASALGANIYPNKHKEIGWFPVRAKPQSDNTSQFQFPSQFNAMHWHGETFDLPSEASHLAYSKACEHQAFQVSRAIGLQFHIEMNSHAMQSIITHCRHELLPEAYVQSEDELTQTPLIYFKNAHKVLYNLLEYLTSSR